MNSSRFNVWKKLEELALKLRKMDYYVDIRRSDDEMFERFTIIIEKDKTKEKDVDYFG